MLNNLAPGTKRICSRKIIESLFKADNSLLERRLTALFVETQIIIGKPVQHLFIRQTRLVNPGLTDALRPTNQIIQLPDSLYPQAQEYLEQLTEVERKKHYILAYLTALLNICESSEDIFAALPKHLHDVLPLKSCSTPGIPTSFAQEELDQINGYHKKAQQLILEQMTLNLLTRE